MHSMELKTGLYYCGVLDPNLRVFDIIMRTEFGTTYNAYLVKGKEKTALIETSKAPFTQDYLNKLREVVAIEEIDYIVVDHTEPDHAGCVEALVELNPGVTLVGTGTAINFLKQIVSRDFCSMPVKDGDKLDLGGRTLSFMALPNLHWPDTMFTYLAEDKVLFPCDAFGAHYSHEGILRSTLTDVDGYLRAAKYYFDNIIGPFKHPYMDAALKRVKALDIDMILPGHGPVLDRHVDEIIALYDEWCRKPARPEGKYVVMPYVSAYGYTRQLAGAIARGVEDTGNLRVNAYDMVEADPDEVLSEIALADGLLFGTPTIVGEALKPIWDLTTSMFAPVHKGKLASAFGSYGWSGEGVPNIIERLKQLKLKVVDGYRVRFKPTQNDLSDAYEYGYDFGCMLAGKENEKKKNEKAMVKCLICGAVFEAGMKTCPVCGAGETQFVQVAVEESGFARDTEEIFLVLGGGAAAVSAAEAIRERNKTASIVMVTDEETLPYNRPMLTKNLLTGLIGETIAIHDRAWYDEKNVFLYQGQRVLRIDPSEREVHLAGGVRLKYDKCVYALGAESFIPPYEGKDLDGVFSIRRMSDARKLAACAGEGKRAVVVGGGVLGLEAAWELKRAKCDVTVLEMSGQIMSRQLDAAASGMLAECAVAAGVAIRTDSSVESIEGDGRVTGLKLKDGSTIAADLVVISTGVRANAQIAQAAGAEVGRAIKVDEHMATGIDRVYAAGDCAEFEGINYSLWPEACEMGRVAGANAAGEQIAYAQFSPALTFQGMNTCLFAAGDNGSDVSKQYKTVEFRDAAKRTLERYYFVNGRLSGAILLGDISKLAKVSEAVQNAAPFKEMFV